ncbi:hypothetical protein BDN71DRAFT_1441324 [Pleurotus eryngii]|uniref:RNA-dependent RNA polymerase n=1 Tax=Pleurotus eryngii TaxID=5323 RepID=A0A9P6A670_PLEER|nr:hypothetical protein BDN71DRAFT_1441324 [Pleurotus eryngii]
MGDSVSSRTPAPPYVASRAQQGNMSVRATIVLTDSESDADELPYHPQTTAPSTPSTGRTAKSASDLSTIRANLFSSIPRNADKVEIPSTLTSSSKMSIAQASATVSTRSRPPDPSTTSTVEVSDEDNDVSWPKPTTKSVGKKTYKPLPRRPIAAASSAPTLSASTSASSCVSSSQACSAPTIPEQSFQPNIPAISRSNAITSSTTAQAAPPGALHGKLFRTLETGDIDSDADKGPSWPSPSRKSAPKTTSSSSTNTPPTPSTSSASSISTTLINTPISTSASDVDMQGMTRPETDMDASKVSKYIWDILDDSVPTYIIAYDEEVHALVQKHHLSFGVQYELARGVVSGRWTWDEVKSKLVEEREVEVDRNGKTVVWSIDPLRPTNHQKTKRKGVSLLEGDNVDVAWRVGEIMKGNQKRKPNLELWRELDREEKAMQEGKGRGLGLMGDWDSCPNWYGGLVQLVFRLHKTTEGFKILVEPLESRRSHYFSRMLGSKRLAQIRIPDDYLLKDIKAVRAFLRQRFVFMGAAYLPYHAKDGNSVYCIDTSSSGDGLDSLGSVCEWHNPIELNYRQPIAKYSTRNTLGFSNSVPVLEFAEEDIHFDLPDLLATEGLRPGVEPLSHQLMTDGCGFMNRAALLTLRATMGLESPPCLVQGRIAGAKGVWALHPKDTCSRPRIWIRPSQNKIKLPRPLDRAHRIFNLLRTSRKSMPCSLSTQIILNLSYNGVPHETLVAKLGEGLRMELRPLMDWTQPRAMEQLWHAVMRLGHVGLKRAARVARVESRALGLAGRDRGEVEIEAEDVVDDIDDVDEPTKHAYAGRNTWSGLPVEAHETIIEAVQAGFKPNESRFLYEKLHSVFKFAIDDATKKYRLPVMQSTTAIMIPDPKGVLREGEVYYKPSSPFRHPITGELLHTLKGDILIGRYPMRLASDVQKVKAVEVHELQNYVDVLILPTTGSRSLASVLSGGDYDGDEDIIIWDPDIVGPFRNHEVVDEPEGFLTEHFKKQVEKVPEFCSRLYAAPKTEAQRCIFDILLLNVCDSRVGLYSKFHDCAVWQYGLNHPKAVLMAYIFNTLLDAPKTGLQVMKRSFIQHQSQFNHTTPWDPPSDEPSPPPQKAQGAFVLHDLRDAGQELKDQYLEEFERFPTEHDEKSSNIRDASLLETYRSARRVASMLPKSFPAFRDELDALDEHVKRHIELYSTDTFNEMKKSPYEDPDKKRKAKDKGSSGDEARLARLVKSFYTTMPESRFTPRPESVAASYAYQLHPRFAFTVAFKTLGTLKALAAEGGIAPCTRNFDEGRVMSASFLRAIQNGDDDD